jgi:hypothetical protein
MPGKKSKTIQLDQKSARELFNILRDCFQFRRLFMPNGVNDILEKMHANPTSDWTIADIETVCRSFGIRCATPFRGRLPLQDLPQDLPPVPTRNPDRAFSSPDQAVYVRNFVRFVDAVGGNDAKA